MSVIYVKKLQGSKILDEIVNLVLYLMEREGNKFKNAGMVFL